ncbi:hypothetical protein D915_010826, partial [Fasciola hepatica]
EWSQEPQGDLNVDGTTDVPYEPRGRGRGRGFSRGRGRGSAYTDYREYDRGLFRNRKRSISMCHLLIDSANAEEGSVDSIIVVLTTVAAQISVADHAAAEELLEVKVVEEGQFVGCQWSITRRHRQSTVIKIFHHLSKQFPSDVEWFVDQFHCLAPIGCHFKAVSLALLYTRQPRTLNHRLCSPMCTDTCVCISDL